MENGLLYYDVDARVIKEAEYIIKERATVRSTAKVFGVSKSTVHHDLTTRLEFLQTIPRGLLRGNSESVSGRGMAKFAEFGGKIPQNTEEKVFFKKK